MKRILSIGKDDFYPQIFRLAVPIIIQNLLSAAVIMLPPPISIVTMELTAPLLILITFPFNWLRALNFIVKSSFHYLLQNS